ALVEAAQRLVALEDVLQGPPPGRAHAERESGRRDRPVGEVEARRPPVLLPQLLERARGLPAREHPLLETRVIGFVRQRLEDWLPHREGKSRLRRSYLWQAG